jgi:hypothetical protein
MKTLFKIFLVGFVLLLVALVGGYFLVTNAGFQKRMLEGKLPAGSSIKHVHVTTSSLQLTELTLVMPDGMRIKVAEVDTSFSPLAAIFDNTLKVGALDVDGLVVQLPTTQAVLDPVDPSGGSAPSSATPPGEIIGKSPAEAPAASPWEAVNSIGSLDWLLDIELIKLNGKLVDGSGNTYVFDVKSGAIRPSLETVVDATLQLVSSEPIQSGLKEFNSSALLRFTQKATGGFEQVHLESETSGKDDNGREVLALSNKLDLSFNGFEETADLAIEFKSNVARPEIFMPELVNMGALNLEGSASAKVDGVVMTLTAAQLGLSVNSAEVVALNLKKALNLGGKQNLSGELLEVKIVDLPFAWFNPWLPEGMFVDAAPFSAQLSIAGLSDGAMELRALSPLRVGPVTVRNVEQMLLQEATLVVNPMVRVNPDQSVVYELKALQLLDRYGEILSGAASGQTKVPAEASSNPLAGQTADVKLKIGLQELFQQPMLADKASVLGGSLEVTLAIDGAADFPLTAQGSIQGLRPVSMPGQAKDYRFATQLKSISDTIWGLGLNFEAGITDRPSTTLQLSAQADVTATPLSFKADLKSPQVTVADFDVLVAAFTAKDSMSAPTPSVPVRTGPAGTPPSTRQPTIGDTAVRPPWADLKGEASVDVKAVHLKTGQTVRDVTANAVVSEPLLQFSNLSARLGEGSMSGSGEVRYQGTQANAYTLLANLGFKGIDPSIFSQKQSGSFPVSGQFDGQFNFTGTGYSLEAAADNSVGGLIITGTNGLLTAFELDNRSQVGLGIAGILGQKFDRPGVTALAETIPYFKNMRFENFVFELKRGVDRKVMIPQLKFVGDSLLIDGSGMIAATSLTDVMSQPLQLGLEFGAKGRLTDHLETLKLLRPTVSEDGFRRWNKKVNLGGTLGNPDTSEIMDLLSGAARAAFDKPSSAPAVSPQPQAAEDGQTNAAPETQPAVQEQPREKTKSEKRRDEIEMGLDLLNNVFGN